MPKGKKKRGEGRTIKLVILGLIGLGFLVTLLLQGTTVALFSPKGLIASEQHRLMMLSLALLLEIAIPALFLFYFFAWKYRETNDKAIYKPDTPHNKTLVFAIWAVPTISMLLLASVMWPATHKLAPQKAIINGAKPLTIEVIAMRWKWLFIYPEQHIATVNFIQIPVGTPVQFDLSADETPMSSFWIPQLAGQLYAMTGHINRLNIMADTAGDYRGSAAEINGDGFAGMKFIARASSISDFDQWVKLVGQSSTTLDTITYNDLLKPSQNNNATFYSSPQPNLYATMLTKYTGSHTQHTEHQ